MNSKTSHDSETLAENQQVITACAFIHKNIDGVSKVSVKANFEQAKATIAAQNSAKLAEAGLQGAESIPP